MPPVLRRRLAFAHLVLAVVAGVWTTIVLAREPYERVLLGISWYAIALESVSVLANTDVRAQQEDDDAGPD